MSRRWAPPQGDDGDRPTEREPWWWRPGDPIQTNRGRYTRTQAIASVGPGWSDLAGRAWDAVTASGARVVQVKEKMGQLTVYHRDLAWSWDDSPARALRGTLASLTADSTQTCEACGAPGYVWTHDTAPPPISGERRQWTWHTALCEPCAFRFYALGACGWDCIAGRWSADHDVPPPLKASDDERP